MIRTVRKVIFWVQLTICLLMVACTFDNNKHVRISGDLCFPWLRMSSFYGQPDSVFQYYKERRESMAPQAMMAEDSAGTSYLLMLEKHRLLKSPFIYLMAKNGSIVPVFMNTKDYERFKDYDYATLRKEKKKVEMKLTVETLSDGVYLCQKIDRLDLVSGWTLPEEGRFRIKNYQ